MTNPDLVRQGRESNSPFGTVFANHSMAFASLGFKGLEAAFAPGANMVIQDRRNDQAHTLTATGVKA